MRHPIVDCFQELPISPQRKYQLRKQMAKKCTICGKPSPAGFAKCDKCAKVLHYSLGNKRFNDRSPRITARQARWTREAIKEANRVNAWLPKELRSTNEAVSTAKEE